ncbi:FAD-dependent monooxygenase [Chitinimonas viridis]|uniref:FAD-dependent monooxygenase n=1 Tax=Chitinimonas viridis TaxID=664880 RepID=A0ABT8B3T1_9NEIS|nr:FAD-dependent monooxygenase [Chitinimonas viridis]MDN3576660.1 FAD-dependent monooxygenase [Chitinimonas viridis]
MTLTSHTSRVGIVGAGPVGLTLAARLATQGIPSIVLDKSPHLMPKGSKACLIQGDVLEVLDKIGCADRIAEEGIHWRVAHTYIKDVEMITQTYPERVGFGQFVNISQYRIEQELLAYVEQSPLTEVRWSHEVTAVAQHDGYVGISVTTPEGDQTLTFDYLVACDGVRSKLRDLTGVEFTGYTHQDRFLITDIRANIPRTKERHFFFDSRFNPGRQLVMHPQPDNIWRIDWQLAPGADIDKEQADGRLDARIRKVIGDIPYKIEWLSTYRFNQRVVERFKLGRIFFAGDAAHSLPPYGSRGMNSGIQDADNLSWKLAYVLDGKADERLLDSYHDERYPAAVENLRVTEATMRFMAPPTRWERLRRSAIFQLAVPFKGIRRLVDHGKMAEPFVYENGTLYSHAANHPLVGQFAPDGSIYLDGTRSRLRKLFGDGFVCLFFGTQAESDAFSAMTRQLPVPVPLKYVLTHTKGTPPPSADDGTTVAAYDDILFYRKFYTGEPAWYLIRPDGHIATRGALNDALRLREAVLHSSACLPTTH